MARIISGAAGGRRLRVPQRGTRPTTERVREALFNALEAAGEIEGARVLDLYAGSGSLGLEALSRGAAYAWFVEHDRAAARILRKNVAVVGLGGTVLERSVASFVRGGGPQAADLVLIDPPYAVADAELRGYLHALAAHQRLAPAALVILERAPPDGQDCWPGGYEVIRVQRYRDTTVYWAEFTAGPTVPPVRG